MSLNHAASRTNRESCALQEKRTIRSDGISTEKWIRSETTDGSDWTTERDSSAYTKPDHPQNNNAARQQRTTCRDEKESKKDICPMKEQFSLIRIPHFLCHDNFLGARIGNPPENPPATNRREIQILWLHSAMLPLRTEQFIYTG